MITRRRGKLIRKCKQYVSSDSLFMLLIASAFFLRHCHWERQDKVFRNKCQQRGNPGMASARLLSRSTSRRSVGGHRLLSDERAGRLQCFMTFSDELSFCGKNRNAVAPGKIKSEKSHRSKLPRMENSVFKCWDLRHGSKATSTYRQRSDAW